MIWDGLPNSTQAVIEERKLTEYLLNQHHPGNGGKAAFFRSLGYGRTEAPALTKALADVAHVGLVVRQVPSVHGRKFVVDGAIPSRIGGVPRRVRSVWMIETEGDAPRFVTAYPDTRGDR